MPRDYITREAALIVDNLVIRIVDDETFRARDATIVQSMPVGPPLSKIFLISRQSYLKRHGRKSRGNR
jgi:hypothetical protein